MFYTYILYSKKFNKIYIGCTSNLEDRFLSHNEKDTKGYTTRYFPWIILNRNAKNKLCQNVN
ncbi:MAG: putative endonuclease [Crocinitomix sp.]|jgi:putative endonuclease